MQHSITVKKANILNHYTGLALGLRLATATKPCSNTRQQNPWLSQQTQKDQKQHIEPKNLSYCKSHECVIKLELIRILTRLQK